MSAKKMSLGKVSTTTVTAGITGLLQQPACTYSYWQGPAQHMLRSTVFLFSS